MNFVSHSRVRRAMNLAALLGTASFVSLMQGAAALAQQHQTEDSVVLAEDTARPEGQQKSVPALVVPAQGTAAEELPETVLVTGSLISGTAAVGVPVTALRTVDIVETGRLTLSDILKTVPALDIAAQSSPTFGAGTSAFLQNVQIHSLGSAAGVETLLLVNGLRFPPQNYSNNAVNPAIIPQIALERIDILTSGASAVYGSDATAGVINLILKRGYEGAMTQAGLTSAPSVGFLTAQFSQLYGKSWETGNVTVSYSITDSRPVESERRSYYTYDFTPWGLMDLTPRGSNIPGIAHIGNATTVAGAPAGLNANAGSLFCGNCYSIPRGQNGVNLAWADILANPGVQNEQNPWHFANSRPRLQTNQATLVIDQHLTNDFLGLGPISLFVNAFYSNQRGKQVYPAGNGSSARQELRTNLAVPTNNPYYPVGAPPNVRVDYSFAIEVPTITRGGEVAGHWDFGFNFERLPFDWRGKATFSMTDDRNYGHFENGINDGNLSAALGFTVPAKGIAGSFTKPANVPYLNVFCDPTAFTCNDPATLRYLVGHFNQDSVFKIQETGVNLDGPLFDLPGGTVLAAVAFQTLSFHWTFDQEQNINTERTDIVSQIPAAATQRSYAIFGQLNIPVFGEDFTLPLVERFEIELGYRYDNYNTLQDAVWTPKVAANWLVGNGLTLRAAWGKAFRVPSFGETNPARSKVAGVNPLALGTNADAAILGCSSVNGSTPGVAIPGSLTYELNPTCSAAEALRQPGGMVVDFSGGGAAVLLRGHALSPQTLNQWSTGFHFAPTEPLFGVLDLAGLNVDVSWFRQEYKGLIVQNVFGEGPDDPLSRSRFTVIPRPDLPITDPANASFLALIEELAAYPGAAGFQYNPAAIPNAKFIEDIALTNAGSRVFAGIDFNARYDIDLGELGSVTIGAAGYYQTIDKTRVTPTAPLDDRYEGRESGNRLQRVRYRLGWQNESWNATIFANYFGHSAQFTEGANLVPPCFYQPGFGPGSCFPGSPYYGPYDVFPNITPAAVFFDLTVGYQTGETPANEYLRNIGIQFTINDIFDRTPPFHVGARGTGTLHAFDNSFSDLQRTFTIMLTKVW
jgi:iron complex outermembrane recepter protein